MTKFIQRCYALILLSFFTFSNINAQEKELTSKDSIINTVKDYYKLNIKVFQANSTVEDIDAIFNIFTEDFTYVHPKYGGVYSRENLYQGYIRNQKNGGYNGRVADIKINKMIVGLNAVVVEKQFINKTTTGTEDGEPQMTLFELKNGKISKIFEYW
jgi:hypothetical protein